jgi:hypothetical protein
MEVVKATPSHGPSEFSLLCESIAAGVVITTLWFLWGNAVILCSCWFSYLGHFDVPFTLACPAFTLSFF